jgi:hypothetical protein
MPFELLRKVENPIEGAPTKIPIEPLERPGWKFLQEPVAIASKDGELLAYHVPVRNTGDQGCG